MVSKIRVGSRVSGAVGCLIDPPNNQAKATAATIAEESSWPTTAAESNKRRRKVRERYTGLVVESLSGRTWRVLWDQTDQFEDVYAAKLKFERDGVVDATVIQRLRALTQPAQERPPSEMQQLPMPPPAEDPQIVQPRIIVQPQIVVHPPIVVQP